MVPAEKKGKPLLVVPFMASTARLHSKDISGHACRAVQHQGWESYNKLVAAFWQG